MASEYGQPLIVQPSSTVLLNSYGTSFSWFVLYFFVSRYILEPLMPRLHRKAYTALSIPDQRSFTVHHHWLLVKFSCIPAAWPYINIMFRNQALAVPLFPGARVSNADFLSVMYMAIVSSFAWEICYRCKISVVSLIHHIAAIILGCWQLSGEVAWVPYTTVIPSTGYFIDTSANDQQFKIIMTYGVFEVVFESWMHICCILHRRFAGQNSRTAKLWLYGGCWVLLGSLAELGIMAVLWKQFWSDWDIAMKVVMILLHFAFMAAQLHGARIGVLLFRKYRRKAAVERSGLPGTIDNGDGDHAPADSPSEETKDPALSLLGNPPLPHEEGTTPLIEKGVGDLEEEVKGR